MPPLCSALARGKRPRGYQDLVIDGRMLDGDVPAGEALSSAPFTVGGIHWRVVCYPNRHPLLLTTEAPFFYRLVLDEDVAKPVMARFKFSFSVEVEQQQQRKRSLLFFLNSKPKPKVLFKSEGVESFVWKDDSGGWNFRRSSLGRLLRHHGADRFTIRCEVVLINGFRTEEAPPPPLPPVSIPPSDLHEHLGTLLLSGMDADIVLQVGGETFVAHRCVLAARSPVMCRELLAGAAMDQSDTAGVVRIDGVEPRVFRALLHYAYTDALPEMGVKDHQDEGDAMYRDLLVAADRYHLVRLKIICEEKLCRRVTDAGAAVAMLALAEKHHCDGLKKACKDVLNNAPPAKQRAPSSSAFVPFDGHKASK